MKVLHTEAVSMLLHQALVIYRPVTNTTAQVLEESDIQQCPWSRDFEDIWVLISKGAREGRANGRAVGARGVAIALRSACSFRVRVHVTH